MSGAFVAVVGASGVGKDSVIGAARSVLGDGFVFPRRLITRPAGPGEDHVPVSEADFERIEQEGGFALSWRAHGLAYGLPAVIIGAVRAGDVVVANVSRAALGRLPEPSRIVRISVPEEQRRARLAMRGREADADIQARMNRIDPAPDCVVDLEIINDGSLQDAGRALADFLRALSPPHPAAPVDRPAVASVGGCDA